MEIGFDTHQQTLYSHHDDLDNVTIEKSASQGLSMTSCFIPITSSLDGLDMSGMHLIDNVFGSVPMHVIPFNDVP